MQSKISELEERQIINIADGKCLGSMKDIELDLEEGRIRAIVVPGGTGLWGLLPNRDELLIPWEKVVRIGILCKLGRREVRHTFQPRKVQVVRFEGKGVEENRLTQVAVFFFVYVQEELEAYQNELAASEDEGGIVIRYDR